MIDEAELQKQDQEALTAAIERLGRLELFGEYAYSMPEIGHGNQAVLMWTVSAIIAAMGPAFFDLIQFVNGEWGCSLRNKGCEEIEEFATPLCALIAAQMALLLERER